MYKGIAGSEGIGIGNVVIIEEHEIVIENKKITDTDAEIARLQGAIEKFVDDTNAMADRMEKTVGAKDADILHYRKGLIFFYETGNYSGYTDYFLNRQIERINELSLSGEPTFDLNKNR